MAESRKSISSRSTSASNNGDSGSENIEDQSHIPIEIVVSPPYSSDTESDDDVFEPEKESDFQPAVSPRTKQNIEKSIQGFEDTMAQHAERTRDRSNLSLLLSDKSDDEHVPKRVIDLDVENLNAFRDQDPMEEVTLIDTEMANRIEKLVDACARNTRRYTVEVALRSQLRCNSLPNIPSIGISEDYDNAIVIDVEHPNSPLVSFPIEPHEEIEVLVSYTTTLTYWTNSAQPQ